MADKKISQLTAATTPLAGTETLPIVQGGQTVKASAQSIANLAPAELPSQTGNNGKYLTTNGTSSSWASVSAGQNYKTYAVNIIVAGGSLSYTDLYNDTGTTFTYTALTSNGRIQINSATSAFTLDKTVGFSGNVRDFITGDIGICYAQQNLGSSFRFQYITPAGANFDFSAANTFVFQIQIQIYP